MELGSKSVGLQSISCAVFSDCFYSSVMLLLDSKGSSQITFLEQVFVIHFLRSNVVEFSSSLLICLLFLHRCHLRVMFIQVLKWQCVLQRFCLYINIYIYSSSTLTGFLPFEVAVCKLTEDGDTTVFAELKTVLLRGYLLNSLHHIRVLAECCLHTEYLR